MNKRGGQYSTIFNFIFPILTEVGKLHKLQKGCKLYSWLINYCLSKMIASCFKDMGFCFVTFIMHNQLMKVLWKAWFDISMKQSALSTMKCRSLHCCHRGYTMFFVLHYTVSILERYVFHILEIPWWWQFWSFKLKNSC